MLSVLNTMLNCVDGSYQDEDITSLKLNAVLDRVFGISIKVYVMCTIDMLYLNSPHLRM